MYLFCFNSLRKSLHIYVGMYTFLTYGHTWMRVNASCNYCMYLESQFDVSVYVAKFLRETMQRVKELVQFGGFSDCEYLQRTLAKEFQQLEFRYTTIIIPSIVPICGVWNVLIYLPIFKHGTICQRSL